MAEVSLHEYDDIIESKYRDSLEKLSNSIKEGSVYTYDTSVYNTDFDNIALLAFPQTELTIVVASIAAQEMYDDLLALKRAAIIADKDRASYYTAMEDDIQVENNYLDKRAAFFKKAMDRLDIKKKSKEQ